MSLPDQFEKDSMDGYIRAQLKWWAARETPPRDGLNRLLWGAAGQHQPRSIRRVDNILRWLLAESGNNYVSRSSILSLNQAKINSLQLCMISVY